jgi:hypothetical protein
MGVVYGVIGGGYDGDVLVDWLIGQSGRSSEFLEIA